MRRKRMIRVLVAVVLAALVCTFAAGCEDLLEDFEDEDDYDFNGNGNGNGDGGANGRQVLYDNDGNPYYDLSADLRTACPVPDDNTAYEGIRYWRGDACARTITGECTGSTLQPVFNCGQSCQYRFTYEHGTSYQREIAIGWLHETCATLRRYGEGTIQSCVPCDGL